jgi:hypothetical protein
MDIPGPEWTRLAEYSVWLLLVTAWEGVVPGATHWRGELEGYGPRVSEQSLPRIPITQWDDLRIRKWIERQMDQFHTVDINAFLRTCSRNRGGPGPGDFYDEATLISVGTQLFCDYALPGTKLYLKVVSEGALLAEIAPDGSCTTCKTDIVGLQSESTIRQLTRPYPTRRHRGDGD